MVRSVADVSNIARRRLLSMPQEMYCPALCSAGATRHVTPNYEEDRSFGWVTVLAPLLDSDPVSHLKISAEGVCQLNLPRRAALRLEDLR